jgi:glyoxylase I family protein
MDDTGSPSPPFTLVGIEHVLLLVNGLEASLAFYQDVLGAQLEARIPRFAMAELRAGSSHLDLVDVGAAEGAWAVPPVAGGRNLDHLAVRLGGSDETSLRRHLEAHGVAIVEERVTTRAKGRRSRYMSATRRAT